MPEFDYLYDCRSGPVVASQHPGLVRPCHLERLAFVISTERSEWRDLMRPLDYARGDIG